LTFSLAQVWVESVVDEKPGDLSVYGLDKPSSRTVITDSSGKQVAYILGDMSPSRNAYYLMQEGDPRVFTVSAPTAAYMQFFLSGIRKHTLFPSFELAALKRLRIDSGETHIEINAKEKSLEPQLAFPYATHILSSPYKNPRGINSEVLNNIVKSLSNLTIADFIDDNPSSLQPFGLDKPARVFLQTDAQSLELLIGAEVNGKRYAKLPNAPGVFTLGGMDTVINVKPFDLFDKFVLLVNIDWVDHLTVSGGEKELSVDFQGKGDDAVYSLNGRKAESKSFKDFYQAVIGILVDAEIPKGSTVPAQNSGNTETGNITIEYRLNTPPGARASITFIPYNREFYALKQEGAVEFLISRDQVRKIFETADAIKYGE